LNKIQHFSYIYRPGKKVILFLHGLGLNKETGINFFLSNELSDYGILIPDLTGHGKTNENSEVLSYKFEIIAVKLIDLLTSLKIENYNLVVHSISSFFIPFLSQLKSPEHIIFIEGNITIGDGEWSRLLQKMNKRELEKHVKLLNRTSHIVLSKHIITPINSYFMESYAQGFKEVKSNALFELASDAFHIIDSNTLANFILNNVDKILYISGENGTCSLPTRSFLVENKINTIIVNGAGHYPHIDCPKKINEVIANFITSPSI
jgi:pimeloyl-ACP methyl ester carboxylesterase